ncbi:MAG: lamin tail domain-containing protein [Chitinivibrionales bacterium]|nr:lamin tail domain-containing protein [Chitinivibrionales bacterium]
MLQRFDSATVLALTLIIVLIGAPLGGKKALSAPLVLISEVMKDPIGGESSIPGGASHEFIEIINIGCDTFFFSSIFLSDGYTSDSLFAWTKPLPNHSQCCFNRPFLLPGQVGCIMDRDYSQSPIDRFYAFCDSTVILTTSSASLAGGLTETKGIFLYRGTKNLIVDSIASVLDPGQSLSLTEKMVHTNPPLIREGFSIVPQSVFFALHQFTSCPDSLSPGRCEKVTNSWFIEFKVMGMPSDTTALLCSTAVAFAQQAMPSVCRWIVRKHTSSNELASGFVAPHPHPFRFVVIVPRDTTGCDLTLTHPSSNTVKPIDISCQWIPEKSIRINEIAPAASVAMPEWIELYNCSSMMINLKHWRIATPQGGDTISSVDCIMQPKSFCIITKDAARLRTCFPFPLQIIQPLHWQTLGDKSDSVYLFNPFQTVASEEVYYDSHWFSSWNSQSLERVNPHNNGKEKGCWAVAVRSSPGMPNQSALWQSGTRPSMTIAPIPFTPDNDGKDDLLMITLQKPASYTSVIEIYGFNGRKLYEITKPSATQYWNGKCATGAAAPIGPFFVIGRFINGSDEIRIRNKGILWR